MKNKFNYKYKKNIFLWKNPKRLLNKYFIKNKKNIEISMFLKIIYALPKFLWFLIYKRDLLFDFYKNLPKSRNLKQTFINFYSLLFFTHGFHKYSNSIFIIGDQLNPMNKGLLQVIEKLTDIEVWIINQGSGSLFEKISHNYSKNIT